MINLGMVTIIIWNALQQINKNIIYNAPLLWQDIANKKGAFLLFYTIY